MRSKGTEMIRESKHCESGGTGRRSGLKIRKRMVSTALRDCSPPCISAFFEANQTSDSCTGVRDEHGSPHELALERHRLAKLVLVGIVTDQVDRFAARLKERVGGCVVAGRDLKLAEARKFVAAMGGLEVAGPWTCATPRCVLPAHAGGAQ